MKRLFYLFLPASLCLAACNCNNNSASSKKQPEKDSATIVAEKKKSLEDSLKSLKPNDVSAILAKQQVPVLCYHRIETGRFDEYTVTPEAFSDQMKTLADSGYKTITPEQLYNHLVYNVPIPEKPVIISFDDRRLEHATIAAPVLEQHGFKGVFFVVTQPLGHSQFMNMDELVQLAKKGHIIALHSYNHTMVTKYGPADWIKQCQEPQKKLQELTGTPVESFAYPYGIYSHKAGEEAAKYFKLSFILSTKRDTLLPLQSIRRMIIPSGWSPAGMLKVMEKTFATKKA